MPHKKKYRNEDTFEPVSMVNLYRNGSLDLGVAGEFCRVTAATAIAETNSPTAVDFPH